MLSDEKADINNQIGSALAKIEQNTASLLSSPTKLNDIAEVFIATAKENRDKIKVKDFMSIDFFRFLDDYVRPQKEANYCYISSIVNIDSGMLKKCLCDVRTNRVIYIALEGQDLSNEQLEVLADRLRYSITYREGADLLNLRNWLLKTQKGELYGF